MPEFNEQESDDKIYTLSKESLTNLLTQSFRSGVLSGYQSLYNGIEENVKDEHFQGNADMLAGFNYCKGLIETMITVADKSLASNLGNDV